MTLRAVSDTKWYLIPLLVLSLASPTAGLASACCQSDDTQVARLVSETCCCPSVSICDRADTSPALLGGRLAQDGFIRPARSSPSHAHLVVDLHVSLHGDEAQRLFASSASPPAPRLFSLSLPLRL